MNRPPHFYGNVLAAMTSGSVQKLRVAACVAALGVAALYFFQSATLAPNHTDEALTLLYIDAMAHGKRPFFDFIDAYGLLNWVFPVLFYKAFGNLVWGIRMWLVLLKVVCVAMVYVFVRGAAGQSLAEQTPGSPLIDRRTLYAGLAALWSAILLGAKWQSLQTAYAFLTVLPFVLAAWHFMLSAPLSQARKNVVAAALFTSAAIWTKLNTGMYLAAGGLFAYFYFLPVAPSAVAAPGKGDGKAPRWFSLAQKLGLVAYGLLFLFAIRREFDGWFFLYLAVPLFIVLHGTHRTNEDADADAPLRHVSAWFTYLIVCAAASVAVLFGYYGRHTGQYIHELAAILAVIDYTAAFPPLGAHGLYVGLLEYYWLELPLVVTALFVVWLSASKKWGALAFGDASPKRRAVIFSAFMLVTLHTFVMYARADETHIFQALLLTVPVFFLLLAELDALYAASARSTSAFRLAVVALVAVMAQSLFVVPTAASFRIGPGDWHNPKLAHLTYRDSSQRYVQNASPHLTDNEWDRAEDDAGAFVKKISRPGDPMLDLMANGLIYFDSNTAPAGGRYHFYFYLASVGLLHRETFERLVPPQVLAGIFADPPHVIVSGYGHTPLLEMFPEFGQLLGRDYVLARHFRHILIYVRRGPRP